MNSFSQVYAQLRRKGRGQYLLLAGCCLFSTLLITAYILVMRSPTVLTVLPEGGDSRKQMMMIFALTVVGCGIFTAYASGLFFRYKSRESGIFLALGATKAQLGRELRRELALLALVSCAAGMALGGPLAWGVWRLFRALVVDTQEMPLVFDPQAYGLSLAFSLYVLLMLFWMLNRFLRRANILDIISESRRSELVREVPLWYGPLGVVLVVVGAFVGYLAPGWIIRGLHWYPPGFLTAVFFLPAAVGLYWLLLHTVVNGWRRGRNRYPHLVTTSIMRFQGRQTVRNLLVVTVLVAAAYFAAFYAPILGVGSLQSFDERRVDYAFHYRADQDLPRSGEIAQLAAEHGVSLTDYIEESGAVLAFDGLLHVEEEGPMGITYSKEYREVLGSCTFLPESAWNALTGDQLDLAPGTVTVVFDDNGNSDGVTSNDVSLVTNVISGVSLAVTPAEPPLRSTVLFGRRVLDDGDYAALTAGLPADLRQVEVVFAVANADASYSFAKALFNRIVDASGPEVEVYDAWDPVQRMQAQAAGQPYYFDNEYLDQQGLERIDYQRRDSSDFRLGWKYMPCFRVLEEADFIRTMAVYLMLFIFIAILCFGATLVILFTRSMTIALSNRQVYADLRRLGASESYLRELIRQQLSRAFFVPTLIGTTLICAFYSMILFFNDSRFSAGELAGMAVCLLLVLLLSGLIYAFYRLTLSRVRRLVLSRPLAAASKVEAPS